MKWCCREYGKWKQRRIWKCSKCKGEYVIILDLIYTKEEIGEIEKLIFR